MAEADMAADMEVHMAADMEVHMVADMEVDKVADKEADLVVDVEAIKKGFGTSNTTRYGQLESSPNINTFSPK